MEIGKMSLLNATVFASHGHVTFDWVEYTVFALMLGLSVLMGMYYGFVKSGKETVSSYILGDKNMNIFPVIMSLISSHLSGITLIGVPSETYMFGTQYYAVIFVNVIVTLLIVYLFIPVFYKLQLNSVYEYLEMRFCHKVRIIASMIFAFYLLLYIPVVIYVPALAFNQLTGYSVHIITPIVSVICIFYTTLGGLKGVSWTVAMQSLFTLTSVIFIVYIGCCNVGSISEVFRKNSAGHRLEIFNMDPNPFARNTFWTVTIGATFNWLATLAIQPGVVQRFLSVPTQRHAVLVMLWGAVGVTVVKSLTVFMGLLMYATYSSCDPFATGEVEKSSQLLPFYVLDIAGQFRGLTGLFIAGVFSAALSTMSCSLNAVAGTIYEDFVTIFYSSEKHAPTILKSIVVILGTLCVTLVFVVEHLGGVLQVAVSLGGIANGTLLTIFTLGFFFPWVNSKGAIAGIITSFTLMSWIVGGSQLSIATGRLRFPGKITGIDHCPANLTSNFTSIFSRVQNYTGVGTLVEADDNVHAIFKISYMYYCMIGTLLGVAVALLTTLITGANDLSKVNPDLVAPPLQRFVQSHKQKVVELEVHKLLTGERKSSILPISTKDTDRKGSIVQAIIKDAEGRSTIIPDS